MVLLQSITVETQSVESVASVRYHYVAIIGNVTSINNITLFICISSKLYNFLSIIIIELTIFWNYFSCIHAITWGSPIVRSSIRLNCMRIIINSASRRSSAGHSLIGKFVVDCEIRIEIVTL